MKSLASKTTKIHMNGDALTPISIFNRLIGTRKFLLESSLKHEESGRYSFIGANPVKEFRGTGTELVETSFQNGETTLHPGKPLELLKNLLPTIEDDHEFPFNGGAVGYIGYDVISQYESIGFPLPDDREMPDIHLLVYETIVVYDHLKQDIMILHNGSNPEVLQDIQLQLAIKEVELEGISNPKPFSSNVTKEQFIENVKKAKEHIIAGDIFQIVLSQRLETHYEGDPFDLYRKLRKENPSPYMFYLDFEEHVVLGASPESLLNIKGNRVTTNPIAGTRKRGTTLEEDNTLQLELKNDLKELAEHRMLVDLGRNDLGRISEIGSIHLTKYMTIEKYQHVMHIVSEVTGTLRPEMHPFDALVACLPAGTVSGAPKIRAMQLIQDFETVKRGVYGGAVGYYGFNGNLDIALAIRTLVIKNNTAYVQAGAGIVYDSDPVAEYEETLHKAKSLLEVLS
jgi:anthranilate synthase component 1